MPTATGRPARNGLESSSRTDFAPGARSPCRCARVGSGLSRAFPLPWLPSRTRQDFPFSFLQAPLFLFHSSRELLRNLPLLVCIGLVKPIQSMAWWECNPSRPARFPSSMFTTRLTESPRRKFDDSIPPRCLSTCLRWHRGQSRDASDRPFPQDVWWRRVSPSPRVLPPGGTDTGRGGGAASLCYRPHRRSLLRHVRRLRHGRAAADREGSGDASGRGWCGPSRNPPPEPR